MPDFNWSFGSDIPPFQEAVDAFLAKGIMTRAEFNALSAAQRTQAFTAAYVHGADQLQTVYDACLAAIRDGKTLADFAKATEAILTRPWHIETVFRTNVLSAYGRGHWEQAQAVQAMRPYARYSAVMDGRTRPSHARLHGLVYPLDHPFWRTYWPPWDYNCRCGAITLSQSEVDKEGLPVRSGPLGGDLPPPAKKFQSPAAGGEWQPDLSKYHPALGEDLARTLQKLPGGGGAVPNLGEYHPGTLPPGYARPPGTAVEDLGLPPKWRPVMTKKDALAYIEDSQIKKDLYFVTDKKAAGALKNEGFDPVVKPSEVKYFGDGVYLERTPNAPQGSMQGTAKVKLANPYRYDWNGEGGQALTSFRGPLGTELRATVEANPGMTRTAAVTKILQEKGYDGIIASAQGKPLVVAFAREQV